MKQHRELPNPNGQIPANSQIPKPNPSHRCIRFTTGKRRLGFGGWDFVPPSPLRVLRGTGGIWDWVVGISAGGLLIVPGCASEVPSRTWDSEPSLARDNDRHLALNREPRGAVPKISGSGSAPSEKVIVAFIDGNPVYRRDVDEHAARKFAGEALEDLILERLLASACGAAGIRNTPEERVARARVEILRSAPPGSPAPPPAEEDLRRSAESPELERRLLLDKWTAWLLRTEPAVRTRLHLYPDEAAARAGGAPERTVDLPWLTRDMLRELFDPPVETAVFSAAPGAWTDPTFTRPARDPARVERLDRREGTPSSYESLHDEIEREIVDHPPESVQTDAALMSLRRKGNVLLQAAPPGR